MIDNANRKMAEAFGRRLKQARQKSGMGSSELAAKLGLERSSITQYEAGRSLPSLAVLQKLAKILCVSLDRLCFDEYDARDEIQDKELAARLAVADHLQHQHRFLVIEFIESLVAREKLQAIERQQTKKPHAA